MNKQVSDIAGRLQDTLQGEPWYGLPVYGIIDGIDGNIANLRTGHHPHSAVDLIYHMLTWTDFTLKRMQEEKIDDMQQFESMDWREIDPQIHGWEEGVAAFKAANAQLLHELSTKNDEWLQNRVEYREYTFDVLLRGLIEHHIYHAGQINFIGKSLS